MEFIKAKTTKGREVWVNNRVVEVKDVEQSDTIPGNVLLHHEDGTYECHQDDRLETYTI